MTLLSFPKAYRLRKRGEFRSLKSKSLRFVGKWACIDYRPSPTGVSRLGITASGKYGNSCERNRFKRLAREAFRKMRPELSPFDIHIVPRQLAKTARSEDIEGELRTCFISSS